MNIFKKNKQITYSLTRKLNLKRFFPEMSYETVDFCVEGCDSPEKANQEIQEWIKDWILSTKKKQEEKAPF